MSFSQSMDRYITGNYGEDNYTPTLIERLEKRFHGQDIVFQGVLAEALIDYADRYDKEEIEEAIDYLSVEFKCPKKYLRDRLKGERNANRI